MVIIEKEKICKRYVNKLEIEIEVNINDENDEENV